MLTITISCVTPASAKMFAAWLAEQGSEIERRAGRVVHVPVAAAGLALQMAAQEHGFAAPSPEPDAEAERG